MKQHRELGDRPYTHSHWAEEEQRIQWRKNRFCCLKTNGPGTTRYSDVKKEKKNLDTDLKHFININIKHIVHLNIYLMFILDCGAWKSELNSAGQQCRQQLGGVLLGGGSGEPAPAFSGSKADHPNMGQGSCILTAEGSPSHPALVFCPEDTLGCTVGGLWPRRGHLALDRCSYFWRIVDTSSKEPICQCRQM